MSRQPEPEFQWIEDAITGFASVVFALVVAVVTIFVNLICAVCSAIAGSDDANQ